MTTAYFTVTDASEGIFVIELTDPDKIKHARECLANTEQQMIHIKGEIVKEQKNYNKNWSFHLKPSSIEFFSYAIEVCDSTMALIEHDIDDVGGAFLPNKYWCPWTSELVNEVTCS